MTFYNIKKLESNLKLGNVSEKEGLYYLVANTVIYSLSCYTVSNKRDYNLQFFMELLVVVAITILGINKSYNINLKGDNLDFFKRFQAVLFVCGIRLIVFALAITMVGLLLFPNIGNVISTDKADAILVILPNVIFFYMLIMSFKRINSGSSTKNSISGLVE